MVKYGDPARAVWSQDKADAADVHPPDKSLPTGSDTAYYAERLNQKQEQRLKDEKEMDSTAFYISSDYGSLQSKLGEDGDGSDSQLLSADDRYQWALGDEREAFLGKVLFEGGGMPMDDLSKDITDSRQEHHSIQESEALEGLTVNVSHIVPVETQKASAGFEEISEKAREAVYSSLHSVVLKRSHGMDTEGSLSADHDDRSILDNDQFDPVEGTTKIERREGGSGDFSAKKNLKPLEVEHKVESQDEGLQKNVLDDAGAGMDRGGNCQGLGKLQTSEVGGRENPEENEGKSYPDIVTYKRGRRLPTNLGRKKKESNLFDEFQGLIDS